MDVAYQGSLHVLCLPTKKYLHSAPVANRHRPRGRAAVRKRGRKATIEIIDTRQRGAMDRCFFTPLSGSSQSRSLSRAKALVKPLRVFWHTCKPTFRPLNRPKALWRHGEAGRLSKRFMRNCPADLRERDRAVVLGFAIATMLEMTLQGLPWGAIAPNLLSMRWV